MFDPYTDLSEIWKRISSDSEVLALMGLTGKPAVDIAKCIVKRNTVDGLAGKDMRLCMYFRPSRKSRLDKLATEEVLEIDCHVPNGQDPTALKVIARANQLLHGYEFGNKKVWYDGHLGDLPTAPSFYCAGMRFKYTSLI